jgi:hypothetical protein
MKKKRGEVYDGYSEMGDDDTDIYTSTEYLKIFPAITRKYDVVIHIYPRIGIVEPVDKNHIIIEINNTFVLYEKTPLL